MLYELHVIRRCHYYKSYTENRSSAILRRFSHNELRNFWKLWNFCSEFQMKCILNRELALWDSERGLLQSSFLKQSTLSSRKMIEKIPACIQYEANYTNIRYRKPSIIRLDVIRGTQYMPIHFFQQSPSFSKTNFISETNENVCQFFMHQLAILIKDSIKDTSIEQAADLLFRPVINYFFLAGLVLTMPGRAWTWLPWCLPRRPLLIGGGVRTKEQRLRSLQLRPVLWKKTKNFT